MCGRTYKGWWCWEVQRVCDTGTTDGDPSSLLVVFLCFFSLFSFLLFSSCASAAAAVPPPKFNAAANSLHQAMTGWRGGSAWRRLREEERRSGDEEEERRCCDDDESGRPGRKVCEKNLRCMYAEVYIPFSYATATFSFSSVRMRWGRFYRWKFFHLCFTYLRDFYQLVRVINCSFSRDRKQFFSSFFSFFFKSDNRPSQDLAKSDYKTNLRSKKNLGILLHVKKSRNLITCW